MDDTALLLIGAFLTALATLGAAVFGIRGYLRRRSGFEHRLRQTQIMNVPTRVEAAREGLSLFMKPLAAMVKPRGAADESAMTLALLRAGFDGPFAVEAFLAAKVVLAIFLPAMLFIAVGRPGMSPSLLATFFAVCAGGFFSPNLWIRMRTSSRQRAIGRSLPETMDLLVTCVEAGLGLDAALVRVGKEMKLSAPALSEELQRVTLEVQAGMPSISAFRRMADRSGVPDLRTLAAVLIQTEQFGTSIARALRIQAEAIRLKAMQRAEEQAAMVAVKMTIPLILFILPTLLAVVMGPAVINISRGLLPQLGGGH